MRNTDLLIKTPVNIELELFHMVCHSFLGSVLHPEPSDQAWQKFYARIRHLPSD